MPTDRVQTHEFKNIHSLNIEAVTGSVDIKSHNLDKILVISENNMEDPKMVTLAVSESDGELSIQETIHDNGAKGKTALHVFLPGANQYKSIDCISAVGNITFQGFDVDYLKSHAASKPIQANSIRARELRVSTAITSITLTDCEIGEYGKVVTAKGIIDIGLPSLPKKELQAASTLGEVVLRVPTFGDSFQMVLRRNEDMGKIISPFECEESIIRRMHENDTYRTHRCQIDRGSGGPKVDLLTSSGTIRILSDGMYKKYKK
jgi:hypothetical protein